MLEFKLWNKSTALVKEREGGEDKERRRTREKIKERPKKVWEGKKERDYGLFFTG